MEARHCLAAANVIAGLAGEVPSEAAAKESMFNVLRPERSCCLHFKAVELNHCLRRGSYPTDMTQKYSIRIMRTNCSSHKVS